MGVTYTTATGATYVPLQTYTVSGSTTSTLNLSTISGAYTDLRLVASCQLTGANNYDLQMQFNGDTTSTYSRTYLYGDGTTAGSGRNASTTSITTTSIVGTSASTYGFSLITTDIFNYANSTTYKTTLSRGTNPLAYAFANVGLWRATPAPITSITLFVGSGNFTAGSTFSLYGILGA